MIQPYEVILSKKSKIDLSKLEKDTQERIIKKLERARILPFRVFVTLEGRDDYKARSGKYRIFADINKKENRIEVSRIKLRKKAYKKT